MAIIADVLTMVDATVAGVAADTYDNTVAAVRPVVRAASVFVPILVGANWLIHSVALTRSTIGDLGPRVGSGHVVLH